MDTPYNQLEQELVGAQIKLEVLNNILSHLINVKGATESQTLPYEERKKDTEDYILFLKTQLAKRKQSMGRSVRRTLRR